MSPSFFKAFPLKWGYGDDDRKEVRKAKYLVNNWVVGDGRKRRLKEDDIENDAKLDLRFIWLFPLDVFLGTEVFFLKTITRLLRALEKTSLTRTC